MRTVEVYLSIGYANANHRETLEFEDDATDDEIDEGVRDWAYDYIDYGWKE